jgi:putative FmdB family regulatory protein
MPIYDYECMKCKKVFEVIRKIDEKGDEVVCP